jgi:hypothetical protein
LTKRCNEATATSRAHAFLAALFKHTAIWVEEQDSAINEIAQEFRLYMTQDQKQYQPNADRITFYQDVVKTAELMCYQLSNAWMSILTGFKYAGNVNVQAPDKSSTSLMPEKSDHSGTLSPARVPDSQPSSKAMFKSQSNASQTGTYLKVSISPTSNDYQ